MAYIYNESIFNNHIDVIKELLNEIRDYNNDEINNIVSEIEISVEEIENNYDTTDTLFEEISDDLKHLISYYSRYVY